MGVCSDPCSVFEDDRGVMRVRIAGDPDTDEWPYSCTLQNSNLRRDPTTGCMWADPLARNLVTAVQGEFFPGTILAGGGIPTVITNVCNLTITNPDPCRSAGAWVGVTMGWTLDADFDPTVTFGEFTLSRQITGPLVIPAEGAMVETYRNHIGSRTTAEVRVRTQVVILTIPPGGSTNVGLDMQAARSNGSMIWSRAFGVLTAMLASV